MDSTEIEDPGNSHFLQQTVLRGLLQPPPAGRGELLTPNRWHLRMLTLQQGMQLTGIQFQAPRVWISTYSLKKERGNYPTKTISFIWAIYPHKPRGHTIMWTTVWITHFSSSSSAQDMLTSGILYVLNATSAFSLVPKCLEQAAHAWGRKGAAEESISKVPKHFRYQHDGHSRQLEEQTSTSVPEGRDAVVQKITLCESCCSPVANNKKQSHTSPK